jgi:hypothetical protein
VSLSNLLKGGRPFFIDLPVLALEGFFVSSPFGGSDAASEPLRIAASWLEQRERWLLGQPTWEWFLMCIEVLKSCKFAAFPLPHWLSCEKV